MTDSPSPKAVAVVVGITAATLVVAAAPFVALGWLLKRLIG